MLRWIAGLLAIFCLIAVARVEWLDYQAGGAIQQKLEQEPDLKWRTSRATDVGPDPRGRVGNALKSWGVGLHAVAMLLVFLSLFKQVGDGPWRSGWAAFSMLGMTLLVWAFYRQYFAALGW